jgi:hypothetical protein
MWQNYFYLPVATTTSSIDYCIYLKDSVYGDFLKCPIKINWLASTTFDDLFDDYDIAHVCDDVATSSEFYYAIECGVRKIIFWTFLPDKNTVARFYNNAALVQTVFPFNTYFSLVQIGKDAIATTTLNNNDTFGIPLITTAGSFYILPVLASSSMPNTIGVENTNLLRTTLGYIFYMVVSILIIVIIFKVW